MKPGRNDPCPCGSRNKYKRCCMDRVSKQHSAVFDDFEQIAAMNPNLSLDELNLVLQHKINDRNNQPNPDFCGLTPTQMANWLYAPLNELQWVSITPPDDLSGSPVMRYLALILDEAMQNDGSFKATAKGNLPTKLVKQANELLPEFAVAKHHQNISISEFSGSNEDKFNALHYTRILAEMAGIINRRSGHYHVKKAAQKQYQKLGIQAFFKSMLEAATRQYNWTYLDGWGEDADLSTFWLFMLWRLQSHGSIDQLTKDVVIAFPDLLPLLSDRDYYTPGKMLSILIESRFLGRFLEFWGFVTVEPRYFFSEETTPRNVEIQPLLQQAFQFNLTTPSPSH